MSVMMPGAWRCELHRLWTTGDCPDCDTDLIAMHETTRLQPLDVNLPDA